MHEVDAFIPFTEDNTDWQSSSGGLWAQPLDCKDS